jgi:hypothetical protein
VELMHLKPTAGCQISTLIFDIATWGLNQKYCLGLYNSFHGIFIEIPLHNFFQISKLIFDTLLWA